MTQQEQVIDYIERNGSITSYEAYIKLGITQLATRISELEDKGHEIEREWTEKNGKKFKKYSFAEKGQQSMFSDHDTKMSNHKREVEGRV